MFVLVVVMLNVIMFNDTVVCGYYDKYHCVKCCHVEFCTKLNVIMLLSFI
jgi:hypothetical protein